MLDLKNDLKISLWKISFIIDVFLCDQKTENEQFL